MTEKQIKLFNKVLDLNWDVKKEQNPTKKIELVKKLHTAKEELKADMGEEEYRKFFEMGARMFAPKED